MTQIFRQQLAAIACLTVAALVCAVPAAGQEEEPQPRELTDWERAELQSLVEVVGAARAGELDPVEDPFDMSPSFLKGTDGATYVPFTLTIDPGKFDGSSVAVYLYVDDPAPAAAVEEETDDSDDDAEEAVFEDAYFIQLDEPGADSMVRLSRAFSAPGGDYDVYVAVRQSLGEEGEDDAREALPVMLLKRQVSVPDLWTEQLQTSTVLVADMVEPLAAPLSPEEQIQHPYTLGTTRITPKFDRRFGKQADLNLLMLVYNPRLSSGMPNVTVEYNFHTQTDSGEEFFNKTNPQEFNAQTLPPGFSVEAGHQIVAGQSVPLSLFPAGEYRLEIKITDNEAGTDLIRDVMFTVLET
ncbi:MAG: hypothetical protein J4F30_05140 [Acidobacteria bacterium]|nr:hypothetical protein [Acidobacteriota bacterium]